MTFIAAAVILTMASARVALALGESATAQITGADGKDLGTASLTETMAGVLIKVSLKGLPPGAHAFHIHGTGKCEGDFASAGPVHNPFGAQHGILNVEGPMAGDLPNLVASSSGEVEAEMLTASVTLSAAAEEALMDADGAALVVFENPDDHMTEPEGNAGGRIGCGVITPAK